MFVHASSFWDSPIYIYDFNDSRNTDKFKELLKDYKGYIVCDGYAGYDGLKKNGIRLQRCFIHARRYFIDVLKVLDEPNKSKSPAYKVVDLMAILFKYESEFIDKNYTADMIKKEHNSDKYSKAIKDLDDVKGDTFSVQKQLADALVSDSNHILLFDECEYLHHGNVNKIDVLHQIYDESNVPMVLCGTYQLQNILSGTSNHNQPQIFRRLFKAKFKSISKEEFAKYLDDLEKLLIIRFTADVRNELFALCIDVESGGLGIFI